MNQLLGIIFGENVKQFNWHKHNLEYPYRQSRSRNEPHLEQSQLSEKEPVFHKMQIGKITTAIIFFNFNDT